MKLQDVLLKAMAKRITWWEAAEIIGVTDRTMRRWRERRPLPGMLLHIDGSKHCWFQDDRWYDLLVILDDATSEIYYAQLVEEESTRTVMVALREVIETGGLFCALYRDRCLSTFSPPFRDALSGTPPADRVSKKAQYSFPKRVGLPCRGQQRPGFCPHPRPQSPRVINQPAR